MAVDEARDKARAARTNMFVMATMYAGSSSAPVKIRNLSETGALIEGAQIPAPSMEVRLSRGALNVTATVAWHLDGRAGLEFKSRISVAHWLPGGEALFKQERIAAAFHDAQERKDATAGLTTLPRSIVTIEQIQAVVTQLKALGNALADDADVLVRHGVQIQVIDLATQLLERLANDGDLPARALDEPLR